MMEEQQHMEVRAYPRYAAEVRLRIKPGQVRTLEQAAAVIVRWVERAARMHPESPDFSSMVVLPWSVEVKKSMDLVMMQHGHSRYLLDFRVWYCIQVAAEDRAAVRKPWPDENAMVLRVGHRTKVARPALWTPGMGF